MSDQPQAWRDGGVPTAEELERMVALDAVGWAGAAWRREYPGRDSAEHARRLLRRAVNPDRPGEETLRRLTRAQGYDIERLPEPPGGPGARGWYSVYEHAFLLEDGTELCLYELEHDHTSDGRLVCEVYADEVTAGLAAWRHGCPRPGEEG